VIVAVLHSDLHNTIKSRSLFDIITTVTCDCYRLTASDTVTYLLQHNLICFSFDMNTKSNIILKRILYSWVQKQNDIVTWYRHLKINLVVEFQYYILSGTAVFLSLLNRGTERVQEQYKIKTHFSRCGVLPILKVESTSCASRIKFVRCPMGGTNMSSPWLRNDTFHVR
jgi:hypothetical protein